MGDPTLTTTSHLVLGLLARGERTAYGLVTELQRTMGHLWPCGRRTLYEEPRRLVAAGCATACTTSAGRRTRTTYVITDAGRATLRHWLRTAPQPAQLVCEGALRTLLADQGTVAQLRHALAEVRDDALAARLELAERAKATLAQNRPPQRLALEAVVVDLLADHQDLLVQWATRTLDVTRTWSDTAEADPGPALAALTDVAGWLP